MPFATINPVNGETLKTFSSWTSEEINLNLQAVTEASKSWSQRSMQSRCELLSTLAQVIREKKEDLAKIITLEMGKLYTESLAEIEKCAILCDYYAHNAEEFLADEIIESDAGLSFVSYEPLGAVLAVMPWNFPFWQVLRFAIPALAAGNVGVLKHASNVPQCAQAIEQLFVDAGFPSAVFKNFMIDASQVQAVIEDSRIHAVTLTGSEPAGRMVAATAGANLKKSVLELGGSDPFVVLEDADLIDTIKNAVISRFLNAGQTCIAAKRFIVVESVADSFVTGFKSAVEQLRIGDPMDATTTLASLARMDLRDELHQQVMDSIKQGAVALTGCQPIDGKGVFYAPSILDHVKPGQRAYQEELFGPVATIIRAQDEEDALRLTNDTRFGLAGSVWTKDSGRGEKFARQVQAGAVFVNGFVKSDPRLPFGGIKASGYGRELSRHGIREFVNTKTIWIK